MAGPERDSPQQSTATDMMDQIAIGTLGPLSRLTETIDLTLDDVSAWIADPSNRDRVTNLITLLDAQTQLLISQQRLVAVAKMIEVASGDGSPETVRRACSDLLKLRLIDPYREDKRPHRPAPTQGPSEEEVRAAFRELAERTERAMGIVNSQPPPPRLDFPPEWNEGRDDGRR